MSDMQYTRLGRSGLVVSRIGLGMMSIGDTSRRPWHLTAEQAEPLVRHAVEAGITLFDTADMYDRGASEEVTGTLLRRLFAHRDDYVLATKVYFPLREGVTNAGGLSRKHVLSAIDGSLRRLGLDHVDLYQIHRYDPQTPIEETMQALDEVVRAGKARYLGASAMSPGSSYRPRSGPGRPAGRRSRPCRTTTTSPTARRSGRCCRTAGRPGSACCRSARWPAGC